MAYIRTFNPRSPGGERHTMPPVLRWSTRLSIHAPRAGSDLDGDVIIDAEDDPLSIHAPRAGSDDDCSNNLLAGEHLSIHAPRAGSD